jgi:hypothetical protein
VASRTPTAPPRSPTVDRRPPTSTTSCSPEPSATSRSSPLPRRTRRRRRRAPRRRLPRRRGGPDRLHAGRRRPADRGRTGRVGSTGAVLRAPRGSRRSSTACSWPRSAAIGHLTHLSARAVQAPPDLAVDEPPRLGRGRTFDLGVHPVGLALRTAAEARRRSPTQLAAVITDAGTDREHASIKLRFPAACWPRSWSAGNPTPPPTGTSRRRARAPCCAPTCTRRRASNATATRSTACRYGRSESVARRRLRLRAAAETVLDEHPHRAPGAGHVPARPPGPRRDLAQRTGRRAATRSRCRCPSPAPATARPRTARRRRR